jgi:hypothetical protein
MVEFEAEKDTDLVCPTVTLEVSMVISHVEFAIQVGTVKFPVTVAALVFPQELRA